jgi:hypothetical protein
MQVALWQASRVASPIAQAVFSGIRADEACNKIKRIADAQGWSEQRQADWKEIADHLGILRELRNDLLHYGARWISPNIWLVSNQMFAHIPSKITDTIVTPAILTDATADVEKIGAHLFKSMFDHEMTEIAKTSLAGALSSAWRYTPLQQGGRGGTNPGGAPKRSRQPRPSAASRRKAALQKKAEQNR